MVIKSHALKLTISIMLLLGLALAGLSCGTTTEPTTRAEPDPMENWENFDAIIATSRPMQAPVAVVPPPTPTKPPTPTSPPAVLAPNDSCVECHTSQEMLVATADEEEVVEVLSEGEG